MRRVDPEARAEVFQRILTAFRAYVAERGYPPSRKELARLSGYSTSALQYQLRLMEAAGLVQVEDGRARGIRIVEG